MCYLYLFHHKISCYFRKNEQHQEQQQPQQSNSKKEKEHKEKKKEERLDDVGMIILNVCAHVSDCNAIKYKYKYNLLLMK